MGKKLLFLAFFLTIYYFSFSETIIMKDGSVLKGTIKSMDENTIILLTTDFGEIKVNRKNVKNIIYKDNEKENKVMTEPEFIMPETKSDKEKAVITFDLNKKGNHINFTQNGRLLITYLDFLNAFNSVPEVKDAFKKQYIILTTYQIVSSAIGCSFGISGAASLIPVCVFGVMGNIPLLIGFLCASLVSESIALPFLFSIIGVNVNFQNILYLMRLMIIITRLIYFL